MKRIYFTGSPLWFWGMEVAALCWSVWCERNNRLFNCLCRSPQHVLYNVISNFKLWATPPTGNPREWAHRLLRHHNKHNPIDGLTDWKDSVDRTCFLKWRTHLTFTVLPTHSCTFQACMIVFCVGSCIYFIFLVYYFTSLLESFWLAFLRMSLGCSVILSCQPHSYIPRYHEKRIFFLTYYNHDAEGIENIIQRERSITSVMTENARS